MFFSFVFIKAHLPLFRTFVKEKCSIYPKKGYISEKPPTNTKRYMHPYVHSSIICNCQGMKQPKGSSADEWIEDVVYIDNGVQWCTMTVLLSHTKE